MPVFMLELKFDGTGSVVAVRNLNHVSQAA